MPGVLSQEMLRKYITYAKQSCHPKLQSADYDKIAQVSLQLCVAPPVSAGQRMFQPAAFALLASTCPWPALAVSLLQVYAELRRESSVTHGMPIAVRHLESMIRMAEARATMHLREYVSDADIDCAVRSVLVWCNAVAGPLACYYASMRLIQHGSSPS